METIEATLRRKKKKSIQFVMANSETKKSIDYINNKIVDGQKDISKEREKQSYQTGRYEALLGHLQECIELVQCPKDLADKVVSTCTHMRIKSSCSEKNYENHDENELISLRRNRQNLQSKRERTVAIYKEEKDSFLIQNKRLIDILRQR